MKVAPHLIRLYVKTSRRYKKLISKLQRNALTSSYERARCLHELRKVVARLRALRTQLRLAAATGTVALLLNTGQAMAQTTVPSTLGPFVKQNRLTNPLREPILTGDDPALAIVDFDGDGDMDVVAGENSYGSRTLPFGGYLRYFENQTAQGNPLFLERDGKNNPFDGIKAITSGVAPAFADIDADGDLDLFLGQNGWTNYYASQPGGIEYYRNDKGVYSKQTGAWDADAKTGNPFNNVVLGTYVRPVFVDFDTDGDLDVIIGSYQYVGPPDYARVVSYFQNDGKGNFTPSPITVNGPVNIFRAISPAVGDMDDDGDYDILLGSYNYGTLYHYLKQVTPGTFDVETGPWDPATKTGNPFDGFAVGANASPAFVDFDKDGHLDLFVADEPGYNKYSNSVIHYYHNSGSNVFEEKFHLDNPFSGIFVQAYAAPVLLDVDGDTQLDAVVGNKYSDSYTDPNTGQLIYTYSSLQYFRNTEGRYSKVADPSQPLAGLEVQGFFSPQFIDIDNDSDLDIVSGNDYGRVVLFRNVDGTYVKETDNDPFVNTGVEYRSSVRLVDIDNDGDLDLFMGNGSGDIAFFRNDNGQFINQYGPGNPLDITTTFSTFRTPFPAFTDVDHDGDLDVFYGGADQYQSPTQLLYLENTGTPEVPLFEKPIAGMFPDINGLAPQPLFIDYDADGDLDTFVGNYDGTISFLLNENPAVAASFTAAPATYEPGHDAPLVVVPDLVLTDADDDLILRATVSIVNYQPGDKLTFTANDAISGYFDEEAGILYFSGKATRAMYESLLRTVAFEIFADAGGRRKSTLSTTVKQFSFAVYDIDLTNPAPGIKEVNVFVNSAPDITTEPVIRTNDFKRVINLMEITSDIDDNLDPALFTVVRQPSSGAKASIEFVSATEVNLVIDYLGIDYTGTDELVISACDDAAACTERLLRIDIDVVSDIIVYNAVAPHSTGDNRFMRIIGLPEKNKVSIFNRWGDKVFEVENYGDSGSGNVFRGQNDQGNDLPSGTYFYTIQAQGKKEVTGYLTIKQ